MPGFDLNVERVLEHGSVAHGLRELIANALDESALTGTPEPVIDKDSDGSGMCATSAADSSMSISPRTREP